MMTGFLMLTFSSILCLKSLHSLQTKCPVSYVLNFRGWIKLIYDKITLIYSVKNAFNPTSEVQNIENRVFQNALFANAPFVNSHFPNRDYSCLWARSN